MARYSSFLGRKVEVLYRAGDIVLPASGTFVADSGRSIFLEQHFELRGQIRHFRWEIPYQYIVKLEDTAIAPPQPTASAEKQGNDIPQVVERDDVAKSRAHAASALGGATSFLTSPNRPKTV
ncbi:MAG: hypothetical protein PVS2B2_06820 [Candidatus Acidiferrum sp.]